MQVLNALELMTTFLFFEGNPLLQLPTKAELELILPVQFVDEKLKVIVTELELTGFGFALGLFETNTQVMMSPFKTSVVV